MAGEIKSGADGTVSFAPGDRKAVEQQESVTENLQGSSVWQFPRNISDQIKAVPQKVEPAAVQLTDEERTRLVEKFGKSLENQTSHAANELVSTLLVAGAVLSKAYMPVRVVAGGLGAVSMVYHSIADKTEQRNAAATLSSMTKPDAARFGKYQQSMQFHNDTESGGYLAALGVYGAKWAGVMKSPYLASLPTIVGTGAVGLDAVNSFYLRPKNVSNFQTDFEAWKKQMKK